MKKLLSLLIFCSMFVPFAACDDSNNDSIDDQTASEVRTKSLMISYCQMGNVTDDFKTDGNVSDPHIPGITIIDNTGNSFDNNIIDYNVTINFNDYSDPNEKITINGFMTIIINTFFQGWFI